jgi:hypothetical protein
MSTTDITVKQQTHALVGSANVGAFWIFLIRASAFGIQTDATGYQYSTADDAYVLYSILSSHEYNCS